MRQHHETIVMNGAGFAIMIAPVAVIATQVVMRKIRRRKKGGSQ